MPKVTLEFTLPEDQSEFDWANNGFKYYSALRSLDERLRQLNKYGPEEEQQSFSPEVARKWIWEEMDRVGISDLD